MGNLPDMVREIAYWYFIGVFTNILISFITLTAITFKKWKVSSTMMLSFILFSLSSWIGTVLITIYVLKQNIGRKNILFKFHRKKTCIVEITGKKGSGKSYLASQLEQKLVPMGYSVYRLSFAMPLKRVLQAYFGINKEMFESTSKVDVNKGFQKFSSDNPFSLAPQELDRFKKEILPLIHSYYLGKTQIRTLMQKLGDFFRSIDEDFFVSIAISNINAIKDYVDVIIIDDLRFLNEDLRSWADIDHSQFCITVFKIVTESNDDSDKHLSETELEKIDSDFKIVNNFKTIDISPIIDKFILQELKK